MSKTLKTAALAIALTAAQALAASASHAVTINVFEAPVGGFGSRLGTAPGQLPRPTQPGPVALPAPAAPGAVPLPSLTPAPVPSAPAPSMDGTALYNQYCAGCHGQGKRGVGAASIQSAINSNKGGMGSLRTLSSAQISAIAGQGSSGVVPLASSRRHEEDD